MIRQRMGHGRRPAEVQTFLAKVHRDRATSWGQDAKAFEKDFNAKLIRSYLGR